METKQSSGGFMETAARGLRGVKLATALGGAMISGCASQKPATVDSIESMAGQIFSRANFVRMGCRRRREEACDTGSEIAVQYNALRARRVPADVLAEVDEKLQKMFELAGWDR